MSPYLRNITFFFLFNIFQYNRKVLLITVYLSIHLHSNFRSGSLSFCSLLNCIACVVFTWIPKRIRAHCDLWVVNLWSPDKWCFIIWNITKFIYVIDMHRNIFSIENGMHSIYISFTWACKNIRTHFDLWKVIVWSTF